MSYAKLGNSCGSRTVAYTDNKKFFTENDPIYNIPYTISDMYPGNSGVVPKNEIREGVDNTPDYIKLYYGKNTLPNKIKAINTKSSCGSCATR